MPGHTKFEQYSKPQPKDYIPKDSLPTDFSWDNVNGTSFLTKNLNQHLPQYCGSCWAHGALSALGDRIKIARDAQGHDINLAIQFILNCGSSVAGSCHGGSASGTYQFISETGYVPYDTCQAYTACSSDSTEGFCEYANTECSAINTCATCSTFNVECSEIDVFPNASVAEYGSVTGADDMMAEIYARGPIACGVDATPLDEYQGGILNNTEDKSINHIISVVGWGEDDGVPYWIARNSWGAYWGMMGYFKVVRGEDQIGIESACSWATLNSFSTSNYGCYEDGSNCISTTFVQDPADDVEGFLQKRNLV